MKCGICGKDFVQSHGKAKYCSDECKKKAHAINAYECDQRRKARFVKRECVICGKEFWVSAKSTVRTCGKTCWQSRFLGLGEEKIESKPKHISQIDDINREALNSGMSYGQMQAKKYLETHSEVRVRI